MNDYPKGDILPFLFCI